MSDTTNPLKTAGLLAGGALGSALLVFGAAGVAGAQDDSPVLDEPAPTQEDAPESRQEARDARRQAAIDDLIADGVITEDQADDWAAVREAIKEQREAARTERAAAIAEAAGVSVDELQEARETGIPLSEVAGDNLPAVVDTITELMTARINGAVEDGRLTQEQADEKLDGLAERVQERVDNGGFAGREGRGQRGHHGPRGGDVEAPAAEAAEASLT